MILMIAILEAQLECMPDKSAVAAEFMPDTEETRKHNFLKWEDLILLNTCYLGWLRVTNFFLLKHW